MKGALIFLVMAAAAAGSAKAADLRQDFLHPPADARPWVYWYWMNAAVSREGIAADLAAMKAAGVGGAYLMPIKGVQSPPLIEPAAEQLSPEWWKDIRFAFEEADKQGLKLALHDCDGFATGGGPWITPEKSMQKVVWSQTEVEGNGREIALRLPQPETFQNYYRDIAVYAFPAREGAAVTSATAGAVVTSSLAGPAPQYLAAPIPPPMIVYGQPTPGAPLFVSDKPCWIQFAFAKPFTCRTVTVWAVGNASYWANDFTLQVSDDSVHFRKVVGANGGPVQSPDQPEVDPNARGTGSTSPERHASATDSGDPNDPARQARGSLHFRDVFTAEPPRHGWMDWDEGTTYSIPPTTGRVFRVVYSMKRTEPGEEDLDSAKWSPLVKLRTIQLGSTPRINGFEGKNGSVWRISPPTELAASEFVPLGSMVNLTDKMDAAGVVHWRVPAAAGAMRSTSTRWTILRVGYTSTGHYNETGGGGRGLECDKFDPAVARFQFDHWFGAAIKEVGPDLAARVLKIFHIDSWECGSQNWSPVFAAEFRRRRGYDPTPYLPAMAGIPIESPAASERFLRDVRRTIAELVVDNFYRPMADLAHAHGCVFSAESVAPVFVSDGMAHFSIADLPMGEFWLRSASHDKLNDVLDAVSGSRIYGRTIAQSEAFTELHLSWDETPAMLKPLADRNYAYGMNRYVYHVFVENPWLDRHPGLTLGAVGTFFQRDQTWWGPAGHAWTDYAARCQALLQEGHAVADVAVFTGEEVPRRSWVPWKLAPMLPGFLAARAAVAAKADIIRSDDWSDPLLGYAYDSINRDALLRLAKVKDGRLVLPGGASYRILVVPLPNDDDPTGARTPEVAEKLRRLKAAGLKVIERPWAPATFQPLGIAPDVGASERGAPVEPGSFGWTHRKGDGWDAYFVSNQQNRKRTLRLSLRARGTPEVWDAVTGQMNRPSEWLARNGRTEIGLDLAPYGSAFVVFVSRKGDVDVASTVGRLVPTIAVQGEWTVRFGGMGAVKFAGLTPWNERPEAAIRHYAGTATYSKSFWWHFGRGDPKRVWLDLGQVAATARVTVNGIDCGVAWTPPYRVEITSAVHEGENQLEIAVTGTWFNRMAYEAGLPADERTTWTSALYPPKDAAPLPAGLLGPVMLETEGAPPRPPAQGAVSAEEMDDVYEQARTPFKWGPVLHPQPGEMIDCPTVFRHEGKWWMLFASIKDKVGYQTRLATSVDLLHWSIVGTVLPLRGSGWDASQADGGAALVDPAWDGSNALESYRGKYWLSYIGGAKPGYEPDPLSIGLAFTEHPDRPEPWQRYPGNPILAPSQSDARPWERATLFKSTIVHDTEATLGAPFIMFYNAKQPGPWVERIGAAVSQDMTHWTRMGAAPAIDNGRGISGDPQLVRMGDLWVMFYFGAGWGQGARAFDTFACSRDLVHWTKWAGPYLMAPSEPWDATYAHKPWLLKHGGIVYHFYCCVSDAGRTIAVATSKEMK